MGKRWYGSIANRIDENKMYCQSINIGTGVTEYSWSDRHPYEVTKVISQTHVFIRELDAIAIGPPMSNEWALVSNPKNIEKEVRFLWGYWRQVLRNKETGKVKYSKMNLSFGKAEKYYDYEF